MESYRGWSLKGGKLYSSFNSQGSVWEGETKAAVCSHGCEVSLCLEQHECSCGIYSRKDLNTLLKEYPAMDVYGIIYNHGTVFEGKTGLRSEKVTIRALFTADFHTGAILAKNYPGVAIMMPPPEILALQKHVYREDDRLLRMQRAAARRQELQRQLQDAKERYPGGFAAEKERLGRILMNKSRQELIQFAKEYAAIDEWAARVNGGRVEKRSRKAKVGDMVFEANNTMHPYVFIGSCRPNQYSSMRYLLDRNGVLVRRPNIRKWDEEPELKAARQQAIEEWE